MANARRTQRTPSSSPRRRAAIIGAGMAGMACARTLLRAGHAVTVFEKSRGFGGRMATRATPFGGFDHGAQYFTVRDARFARALAVTSARVQPWQANTVRVLDPLGRVVEALSADDSRLVPVPGMSALAREWAQALADVRLEARVTQLERDRLNPSHWQVVAEGPGAVPPVEAGFDTVVLAIPAPQAQALLRASGVAADWVAALDAVSMAPCWTLMLAYPEVVGGARLGPQWDAALSAHHRVAWLTREGSKPGRGDVERWTVQASAAWSREHLEDDEARVLAKMLRAFAEITGIRAEPPHAQVHRWRHARTDRPLGVSHLWDARLGLGLCGDWCIGQRVEDAFCSGLALALDAA